MVHCGFGEFSDPAAEEDGRACKQECTATRLNDPHPKGTEFQYMSLSCCMHSDTPSEGSQKVCQNQYLNYRYVRYTARAVGAQTTGTRVQRALARALARAAVHPYVPYASTAQCIRYTGRH